MNAIVGYTDVLHKLFSGLLHFTCMNTTYFRKQLLTAKFMIVEMFITVFDQQSIHIYKDKRSADKMGSVITATSIYLPFYFY